MKPIVIFYHCYLFTGEPPDLLASAYAVVEDQMRRLMESGLSAAASEMIVGLNGGIESMDVANLLMPREAKIVLHGLNSKCENPTLLLLEHWLRDHPGEADILYFHAKSSSHDGSTEYGQFDQKWMQCMMRHCIDNWRQCVSDLATHEAVGCHWMTGQGWDHSQHYFAGTFWWARASYLRTLPSIMLRERIKTSGLGSAESRYEAEVYIGNGPKLPTIKDYHPGPISH
jgi:hypothetical protein